MPTSQGLWLRVYNHTYSTFLLGLGTWLLVIESALLVLYPLSHLLSLHLLFLDWMERDLSYFSVLLGSFFHLKLLRISVSTTPLFSTLILINFWSPNCRALKICSAFLYFSHFYFQNIENHTELQKFKYFSNENLKVDKPPKCLAWLSKNNHQDLKMLLYFSSVAMSLSINI